MGTNRNTLGSEVKDQHTDTKTDKVNIKEKIIFEDALELTGGGKYSNRLLAISIYSLLAATAEMFTIGLVTTASQCDLDLDVAKKGLLSSIPILGVVVSGHFWGFLADTRGRRFSLIISATAACIAGLVASFSHNWIFLAVMKFIGAIFASGTNALSYTFLGECTVAHKRQQHLLYASSGVLSFQAINAIMAYPILNLTFSYYMPALGFTYRPWRLFLLVIGMISGVNALLIVFFTYESPKFYFSIGEHDKGLKIMQKIYKVNTGNDTDMYPAKHIILNEDDYKTKTRTFLRSVWDQTIPLFSKKSPPFSVWMPFIFNSYSQTQDNNTQFCTIFQKKKTISNTTSVVEECDDSVADLTLIALAVLAVYLTLASLASVFTMKKIGKKWFFVANHVLTFITCIVINRLPIVYGIAAMVGMTANVTCMGIVTTYAIELFPTYMRAMAVCLCILSGRSVSIVFYNVIGTQLENNCDNFIFIISGLILFGAIAGLFLPSDKTTKKCDIKKIPDDTGSDKNT